MIKSVFKNLIFRYILIVLFFAAHHITLSHFHNTSNYNKSCHSCTISKHFKHSKNDITFTFVEHLEIVQNRVNITHPLMKKAATFIRKPLQYHYKQTDTIAKIPIGFNATAPPTYFS